MWWIFFLFNKLCLCNVRSPLLGSCLVKKDNTHTICEEEAYINLYELNMTKWQHKFALYFKMCFLWTWMVLSLVYRKRKGIRIHTFKLEELNFENSYCFWKRKAYNRMSNVSLQPSQPTFLMPTPSSMNKSNESLQLILSILYCLFINNNT